MALALPKASDNRTPLGNFAFHVSFETDGRDVPREPFGAFSEISGLEATMEHKAIKEGGNNYGPQLRVGPVSFATVVLKRGLVEVDNLWDWWAYFAGADEGANACSGYANRCDVLIAQLGLKPFEASKPPPPARRIPLPEKHRFGARQRDRRQRPGRCLQHLWTQTGRKS